MDEEMWEERFHNEPKIPTSLFFGLKFWYFVNLTELSSLRNNMSPKLS